jgi:hypothetical protein
MSAGKQTGANFRPGTRTGRLRFTAAVSEHWRLDRNYLSASCLGITPPWPQGRGRPWLLGQCRGLSLRSQYVPLRWRVIAPTKKRPPYPRGCDGADKPEHNLVHHCFALREKKALGITASVGYDSM